MSDSGTLCVVAMALATERADGWAGIESCNGGNWFEY